jgi:hypothetical protein
MLEQEEQLRSRGGKLVKILDRQCMLADQLLDCASRAESALIEENLEELKDTAEQEEDLSAEFSEYEKRRMEQALALSELLGIAKKNPSLREIAGQLGDRELAERLRSAGSALAAAAQRVQEKNGQVHEILLLKSAYTDTMLGLMTGASAKRNHSYDIHGGKVEADGPQEGIYEVLI